MTGAPQPSGPSRIRATPAWKSLSALLIVVIVVGPTLICGAYFAVFAADQYVAETKLAVRERAPSIPSLPTKIASFAALSHAGRDAYIVASYLRSRNVVRGLDRDGQLRQLFSRPEADFYARFDASRPDEELWRYWRDKVTVSVESLSGVITIRARAFRSEDAVYLCEQLAKQADEVVDAMGARSRANALAAAESEKQRAAERFVRASIALRNFRDASGTIDPVENALGKLEEIFSATTERTSAAIAKSSTRSAQEAPALATLDARIRALDKQIAELNGWLAAPVPGAASAALAEYGHLELESTLAQRQYALASQIVEENRESVESRTSFVATFVPPTLPRTATEPRKWLDTLAIFTIAMIAWSMIRVAIGAARSEAF